MFAEMEDEDTDCGNGVVDDEDADEHMTIMHLVGHMFPNGQPPRVLE